MKKHILLAYSKQGARHIKTGTVCQDASSQYSDEQMSIIAMGDGHGGNDYLRSNKGSEFAVKSAVESIKSFVQTNEYIDINNCYTQLSDLARIIITNWREKVEADLAENPISEQDLERVSERYRIRYTTQLKRFGSRAYGTTLIAVCITKNYWFGMQIGDGKCVSFAKDGTINEPIPWDEKCEGNITTSICHDNALEEFRYHFGTNEEIPAAVFIGSDGIDNSYTYPPMEKVYQLYTSILQICAEHGEEKMKTEFEAYLPILSQKGSGDDVSVCGCIDKEFYIDTLELVTITPLLQETEKKSGEKKELVSETESALETLKAYENRKRLISEQKNEKIREIQKIKSEENSSASLLLLKSILNDAQRNIDSFSGSEVKTSVIGFFPQFMSEIEHLYDQGILKKSIADPDWDDKEDLILQVGPFKSAYNAWKNLCKLCTESADFPSDEKKAQKSETDLIDELKNLGNEELKLDEEYQKALKIIEKHRILTEKIDELSGKIEKVRRDIKLYKEGKIQSDQADE